MLTNVLLAAVKAGFDEVIRGLAAIAARSLRHQPEQVPPILRLANDAGGQTVGEAWFYLEDLPALIAALQEQLAFFRLRPGEARVEQVDLYRQPGAGGLGRSERSVRQYYGEIPT